MSMYPSINNSRGQLALRKIVLTIVLALLVSAMSLELSGRYLVVLVPMVFIIVTFLASNSRFGILFFVSCIVYINTVFAIISVFYPLVFSSTFKTFYVLGREGLIYSVFFTLLLSRFQRNKKLMPEGTKGAWFFLAVGLIYLVLPIGGAPVSLRLGDFKEFYDAGFLFLIGVFFADSMRGDPKSFDSLTKWFAVSGVLFATIAVFELFILPSLMGESPLVAFGLVRYFEMMQVANQGLYGAQQTAVTSASIPGNYGTVLPFIGSVLRSGSLLFDPVALSLLYPLFVISAYIGRRWIMVIIGSVGCVLTYSKSGILLLFYVLGGIVVTKKPKLMRIVIILSLGISALGLALSLSAGGGTANHLQGLIQGLVHAFKRPIGSGLGTAGNLANQVGGVQKVSESLFGVLATENGIPGILAIIVFFYSIVKKIALLDKRRPYANHRFVIILGVVGLMVVTLFTEAALQDNGSGLFLFFVGFYISYSSLKNQGDGVHRGQSGSLSSVDLSQRRSGKNSDQSC